MSADSSQKILLVDTDADAARALTVFVENCGYRAQTVTDYQQALAAVQNWKPDLVVLSALITAFRPLELINEIKKNPFTQAQKIIIFSRTPKAGLITGPAPIVSGYLTKPVEMDKLYQILAELH